MCRLSFLPVINCLSPSQTHLRDSDYDVVGFIEMNGWYDDVLSLDKRDYYSGSLSRRAGYAGFPYAAMLRTPSGYHLGVLSAVLSRAILLVCLVTHVVTHSLMLQQVSCRSTRLM